MSLNKLYSVVTFINVPGGATVSLPHGLNQGGTPVMPDELKVSKTVEPFAVSADEVNITVTNEEESADDITILAERWHTVERELGVQDPETNLPIQPWIMFSAR